MRVRVVRNVLVAMLFAACSGDNPTAPAPQASQRPPSGIESAIGIDSVTGASLETNKDDYVPGEIVHVVLKGWKPGEDVRLLMTEQPETHADVDTTVTVDIDGEWSGHYYDVQVHDLGVTFTLTATGSESGSSATATFFDSQTLTIQSLSPSPPTAGNSFDANLQVVLTNGDDWMETRIRLTRTNPSYGSNPIYDRCFNHSDFTTNGTHSLAVTIPASGGDWDGGQSLQPGTYTLGVRGYDTNNGCDSDDDFPSSSDITTTFTVVSVNPDLTIAKVANSDPDCDSGGGDPDFCVGQPASYTLTITNNGQNATSGTVTVVDTLPASGSDLDDRITFSSGSGSGWTCGFATTAAAPPRHVVTCTTSDVIAGSGGTKVLTLNVDPAADGSDWTDVTNRAWVSGGGDATPASGEDDVDVRLPPDFQITSVVITPQPAGLGSTASANVTVVVSNGAFWRCMRGRVRQSDGSFLTGFSTDIVTDFEPDHTDGTHSQSFNFTVPGVAGTYALRVRVYSDDVSGGCDSDEEESLVQFEVAASAATETTVSGSPDPSKHGQSVTITADVELASSTTAVTSGNVEFRIGSTNCSDGTLLPGGPFALDGTGQASTTRTFTFAEDNSNIRACYLGASGFQTSNGSYVQDVDKGDVTVGVSDSPTSSSVGQSVTFTATLSAVAPAVGTPTGTVTFYDGACGTTQIGSSDNTAPYEVTTSSLAAGTHTITACYGGDGSFNSSSGTDSHSVSLVATTTDLASSVNPSVTGQNTTFTATITRTVGGAAVTAGTVVFKTGGTTCSDAVFFANGTALNGSGQSTYTISFLASQSPIVVRACYSEGTTYDSSEDDITQNVNKANTSTTASDSPDPSVFGESVTLGASVTVASPGNGTPTGTVSFYILSGGGTCASPGGSTQLGSTVAVGNTTTTSALGVGDHTVTACYSGDANFNPSSDTEDHHVDKANSSVTVTDSPTSSVWGQSVTFTAALAAAAPGAGTPGGTVTFYEFGAGESCSSPGAAVGTSDGSNPYQFTTSSLSVGAHTITACYGGDGNFNGNEDTDDHTVNKASTNVTVSSNTPTVYGNAANFSASVGVVAPGAGTPTGTVTFYEFGAGESCASPPATPLGSDASAPYTFSINTLGAGAHTITACYPGDGNFNADDGSTSHTVNKASISSTAAVSPTTQQYSDKITPSTELAAQTGALPAGVTLEGTVTFKLGATTIGSEAVSTTSLSATITEATKYALTQLEGSYTITAEFVPTGASADNFQAGTSTGAALTVQPEDANIVPDPNNVYEYSTSTSIPTITLKFNVSEKGSTETNLSTAANWAVGNINNEPIGNISAKMNPVTVGNNETGTCTQFAAAPSVAYNAVRVIECTFTTVIPDAYELVFTVGTASPTTDDYYAGVYDTKIVSVTDPNAGLPAGGGWIPMTDGVMNFGFNFSYSGPKNNKTVKGGIVAVRHYTSGPNAGWQCRIKTNSLVAPSVTAQLAGSPSPGWYSVFSGTNVSYNCKDALGVIQESAGNQSLAAYVEDRGEPGKSDKFWLNVTSRINMPLPGNTNAVTLGGGNIQVPKP